MSMNMFERFSRVAKANVNEILNKWEDPEKVMNQAVEDLNKDLVKVRQSYAEVMATQKRMAKQKEEAERLTEEWLNRAQLALQKDDEELAREALSRKQQSAEQAASLTIQLETQDESLASLYESMQQLESRITEAKGMREQYVARARTAQTTTKVNDMLSGMGTENAMSAFDRMKDKVENMESQAEVSQALTGASADLSLESKFKELEGTNDLDDELAALKMNILPGGEAPKQLSGDVAASAPAGGAMEDELEKLKREMDGNK